MWRARDLQKALWVLGLCSPAVLPSLTAGLGHTDGGMCVFLLLCCERLLPRQASLSSSWLHSCCSDYISIKTSYHAGRLLYSSPSQLPFPAPTESSSCFLALWRL